MLALGVCVCEIAILVNWNPCQHHLQNLQALCVCVCVLMGGGKYELPFIFIYLLIKDKMPSGKQKVLMAGAWYPWQQSPKNITLGATENF